MKPLDKNQQIDQSEALQDLKRQIENIDIGQYTDQFLTLLSKYHQEINKEELNQQKPGTPSDQLEKLPEEGIIQTPDQLIARFMEIYQKPEVRFDHQHWKSAIENAKANAKVSLSAFYMPTMEFLKDHPMLTMQTYEVIVYDGFSMWDFLESSDWKKKQEEDKAYIRVMSLLLYGDVDFDAMISTIPIWEYSSEVLDEILALCSKSCVRWRHEEYNEAKELLEQISPENRPALVWQRLLDVIRELEGESKDYQSVLQEALKHYPHNEHLLFLKISIDLESRPAIEVKEDLVQLIKEYPHYLKLLHLLGKCYLKLQDFDEARVVFQALTEIKPLHLDYHIGASLTEGRTMMQEGQKSSRQPGILSNEQLWLLALTAMQAREYGHRYDTLLPYGDNKDAHLVEKMKSILTNTYGIRNAHELRFCMFPPRSERGLVSSGRTHGGWSNEELKTACRMEEYDNSYQDLNMLEDYRPNLKFFEGSWHLGLKMWLVRVSAFSGLIDEEEAWELLTQLGKQIRDTYTSWIEFGRGCLITIQSNEEYSREAILPHVEKFRALVTDPNCPWKTVPWDVEL